MIIDASQNDYPALIDLWEQSVRASHHFLPEDYLQKIKSLLPSIFKEVKIVLEKRGNSIAGFAGMAADKMEMLFIHPEWMGKGIGRNLTEHLINTYKINKVDVNEQNENAVLFYQKMGFKIVRRNEVDGLGKPFPILEMSLMR